MHEKTYSKEQVKELIEKAVNSHCFVFSDKQWRYLWQGCDQKQCVMLDMNFRIEKRPGIIIYIPGKTLEDLK